MPILFFIASLCAAAALIKLGALSVMVTVLWTALAGVLGVVILIAIGAAVLWRRRR